jgi:hypothetical protein
MLYEEERRSPGAAASKSTFASGPPWVTGDPDPDERRLLAVLPRGTASAENSSICLRDRHLGREALGRGDAVEGAEAAHALEEVAASSGKAIETPAEDEIGGSGTLTASTIAWTSSRRERVQRHRANLAWLGQADVH